MPGILYIVATPIGNLSDLSARVKSTLETVDLILVEDTRVTIKLLNHMGIKKRMVSCHDYNEKSRLTLITQCASLNQNIALVSDAGTPLISDPGSEIVRQAINCGMNIIPIPGPSACILALIASGLPCDRFVFEGFLPTKQNLLKQRLEKLEGEQRTFILYEAPHRLLKTLKLLKEILGDRDICLARELTKKFEEIVRNKLSNIILNFSSDTTISANPNQKSSPEAKASAKILGEYVLVIAGNNSITPSISSLELETAIKEMQEDGNSVKTITQDLTQIHKLKHSEIYPLALKIQKSIKLK